MATIAKAVVPANAAKMSAGCGGANLTKTESSIEAIADGEGKKEVALAQDAVLNRNIGACLRHASWQGDDDAGMSK